MRHFVSFYDINIYEGSFLYTVPDSGGTDLQSGCRQQRASYLFPLELSWPKLEREVEKHSYRKRDRKTEKQERDRK